VATAFLSAWLDNVTTMLLICPVTISVMRQMNKDPVPLMLSQALMSNIGGAATMVGDPPALIIGTALSNYIGFMDFIVNMAPGVIMASVVCIPLLLWQFRRTLQGKIGNYAEILEEVKTFRILDWPLFAKCCKCWRRQLSCPAVFLQCTEACITSICCTESRPPLTPRLLLLLPVLQPM
jgi:Na+/H+ antiporter NhaD/arsenite permease-like protein